MPMQTILLGGFVADNIAKINSNFSNVLGKDNTTPFTPSSDYNPATKKYVDDNKPGVMTGATVDTPGTSGLVPAPGAGDNGKFLCGDGTYKAIEFESLTYSIGVTAAGSGYAAQISSTSSTGASTYVKLIAGNNVVITPNAESGSLNFAINDELKVTESSANESFPIILLASASPVSGSSYEGIYSDGLSYNPSTGVLSASTFSGNIDGAANATGVTPSTGDFLLIADVSNDGKISQSSLTFGNSTTTFLCNDGTWRQVDLSSKMNQLTAAPTASGQVIVSVASDNRVDLVGATSGGAPITIGAATFNSSPNANTLATEVGVTTYVNQVVSAIDVASFKGTITGAGVITSNDETINGQNITALNNYKSGWMFMVSTAGTVVGEVVEPGDFLICISNYSASFSNDDWAAIQTNITSAVSNTTDSSVTANTVAIFNGTSGKDIKSSGFTIEKSVPANAEFTDTVPIKTTFGNSTTDGWSAAASGGVYTLTLTIESGRTPVQCYRQVSSGVYGLVEVGMQITNDTTLAITSFDTFSGYVILV